MRARCRRGHRQSNDHADYAPLHVDRHPPRSVLGPILSAIAPGVNSFGVPALATELADWIAERFDLPHADVPQFHGADPETAAERVRAAWALGQRPAPNALMCTRATRTSAMTLLARTGLKLRSIEGAVKMLKDGRVAARLPVRDLTEARAFYSEKLGLEP